MKKVGKKGVDVNRLKIAQLISILILSLLLFSCDLMPRETGGVRLSISGFSTSRSLNTQPIDMQIHIYSINLTLQDRVVTVEHQIADGTDVVIDALSPGNWELTITGKNSTGHIVAQLSGGMQHVSIQRGRVTSVSALLVPLTDDGVLHLNVDLTGHDGVVFRPTIRLDLYASEDMESPEYSGTYDVVQDSEVALTISPGWYRAEIELFDTDSDGDEILFGKQVVFPRIVSGQTTAQLVSFTVGEYQVGAIGPAGGVVFHEFASDVELDVVGGVHGTIVGATRETVQGNSGLYFSNDAYVQLGQPLDIVPDIIEAKIFVSEDHGSERVGIILGNYQDGSENTDTMGWEIHQDGKPRIWWDGGNIDCEFNYNVRQSKWILLRWVRDRENGEFVLFVDDEKADGTGTMREIPGTYKKGSGIGEDTLLSQNTRSYRIGSDYPASRQPFDGYISDVKIFDQHGDLAAYYPMDRWMEVALYDVREISNGTPSIDLSTSGYDGAPQQYIFGYHGSPTRSVVGTYSGIGSGKPNTEALVASQTGEAYTTASGSSLTMSYAARLSHALVHRTYSDWFLPSKETLQLIDERLTPLRLGSFSEGLYWSSTETSDMSAHAYSFMDDMEQTADRDTALYVRPVRAF